MSPVENGRGIISSELGKMASMVKSYSILKTKIISQFNYIPLLVFLKNENLEFKDHWKGIRNELLLGDSLITAYFTQMKQ